MKSQVCVCLTVPQFLHVSPSMSIMLYQDGLIHVFSYKVAHKHKLSTLFDVQLKNLCSVMALEENLTVLGSLDCF